jgi:hypothetical protein
MSRRRRVQRIVVRMLLFAGTYVVIVGGSLAIFAFLMHRNLVDVLGNVWIAVLVMLLVVLGQAVRGEKDDEGTGSRSTRRPDA